MEKISEKDVVTVKLDNGDILLVSNSGITLYRKTEFDTKKRKVLKADYEDLILMGNTLRQIFKDKNEELNQLRKQVGKTIIKPYKNIKVFI